MASYTIPRSRTSSWVVIQRNQNSQGKNNWTLLLIFLLSLIIIIILIIIVHLFANHLLRRRRRRAVGASTIHANNAQPVSSTTLDATAIAPLPTFAYHSGGSNEGGESQCMVCLSAPKEGEVMRLLPHCKHFFHARCIDMWLHSHPTCPICRADVNQWRGKGNGQMLASPMMAARVGGARREELSISMEMVEEGCSTLKIGSSFCRRMSMERRQGKTDDVVVDLERQ